MRASRNFGPWRAEDEVSIYLLRAAYISTFGYGFGHVKTVGFELCKNFWIRICVSQWLNAS